MNKALCVLLALCLGMGGLMVAPNANSELVSASTDALTPHGPIRIDSNADFPGVATSGNGSAVTPWIIENYSINGTGNGTCIYIGNTTERFIVRDCKLYNASGGTGSIYYFNSSIMLFNAVNGTVHNNTITNSQYGIYLYNNSKNNTMSYNRIYENSEAGIMMDIGSEGNNALGNSIYTNGLHGVYIYSGHGNLLRFNDVHDNGNSGIYLYSADTNYVLNCTVHNNTAVGVHIYSGSFGNLVKWCSIAENGYGVRIYNSADNAIYSNDFVNNTDQAYDNNATNHWDWGYDSGGNYWDDYSGVDLMSGAGQNVPGADGIGDMPYTTIDGGAGQNDTYPLMNPFNATEPADTVLPYATSWGPIGNQTLHTAKIFVLWNESMNWSSVEAAFRYTDGTTNWSSANGTWNHDVNFNSTFTPDTPWNYETQYWLTVNCTAKDVAGNMLDQDRNGTGGYWPADVLQWNFTVTDEAPYVISTTPANGQVDVDPNKPIKVMFSEQMNRTSVESGFSYTNGTETWDDADGVVYWNTQQTEFTYAPAEPLPLNQTFTATLNGTLVRDAGGKLLDGGDLAWSFTTWLEPPAPHVTDTYPPAGSFNVNVNTYINIAFDSEMNIGSMDVAFSYTDGVNVWDTGNGTVDWFSENSLFSFQPNQRLAFDTTYTVRITSNATSIYDRPLDGNDNGIPDASDDFVFAFTTTPEPPTVISHHPDANQMEVSTSLAAIHINFSKVMSLTSVTNAVSVYPSTPFTPSFSGAGMNLTLVLGAELLEGTQYRVTVLGTATDLLGIKLDGNSDGWAGDKFSFSFITTGLVIPIEPHVISVFPGNNATDVPIESYVGIAFNVAMNRTSVQEAFSFGNATTKLNGTFLWQANSKSFRFIPTEPLSFNMTYYITLQGTAKDEDGRHLTNDTAWQFTTVADTVPTDWTDWIIYGAIIFLAVMVIMLFMANRSLRRDLKRTRVKLKRLKREMGIKDDEPASAEPDAESPPQAPDEMSQPEELPEENAAGENQ